jgi:ribosomal protein S18 acetylase RimI-like enzyme
MKDSFAFRQGLVNDILQLKDLGCLSYGEYKSILQPEHWSKLNRFLVDESKWIDLFSQSTCFVCEYESKIVGMAFIISSGHPWDVFEADWSYIRMVGINPNFRGNGIGEILMQHCINHAKKTNEKVIALHTSEFMNAARHLYEKMGFQILREIEPRLGNRYWLYSLLLNQF